MNRNKNKKQKWKGRNENIHQSVAALNVKFNAIKNQSVVVIFFLWIRFKFVSRIHWFLDAHCKFIHLLTNILRCCLRCSAYFSLLFFIYLYILVFHQFLANIHVNSVIFFRIYIVCIYYKITKNIIELRRLLSHLLSLSLSLCRFCHLVSDESLMPPMMMKYIFFFFFTLSYFGISSYHQQSC